MRKARSREGETVVGQSSRCPVWLFLPPVSYDHWQRTWGRPPWIPTRDSGHWLPAWPLLHLACGHALRWACSVSLSLFLFSSRKAEEGLWGVQVKGSRTFLQSHWDHHLERFSPLPSWEQAHRCLVVASGRGVVKHQLLEMVWCILEAKLLSGNIRLLSFQHEQVTLCGFCHMNYRRMECFPDWHFRSALCDAVTNISRSCWGWRWLSRWRQSIHVTWHSVRGQAGVSALVWTQSQSIICSVGRPITLGLLGRETDTCGSFHGAFSPSQSKVGLTLSEENDTESTQTREEQTFWMLSGKPFLHGLVPIIILLTLANPFLFLFLLKESQLSLIKFLLCARTSTILEMAWAGLWESIV